MTSAHESTPGEHLDVSRMPIYALLARLGKQVLRPGGMGLTRQMLELLDVQPSDEVVEFAPGMGAMAAASAISASLMRSRGFCISARQELVRITVLTTMVLENRNLAI